MSDMITQEWRSLQLGKLFKIIKGSIVPKDNPTEQLEYYSIPVFDQTGSSTVVYGSEIESNKTLISEPAILVSKLNPRKPRVQVVKQIGKYRQCASTEFIAYSPKYQGIYLSFYKYYFLSDFFSNRLQLVATGSTNSHVRVTPSETLKWSVPAPPPPEQKKIAAILASVDKVIETTRAQIDKLKDLKTGMMQELLTKGVGYTEFKDSPVGLIPIDWDVDSIANHSRITTGNKDTKDRLANGKYPFFVRSQNVERINSFSFDGEAVLTAGDGVGTGKVFHYINGRFDFHQRVYKISDFSNQLDGRFFFYYFSNNFIFQVNRFSAKGSVDSVRMEMIAGMQIPLPSLSEQKNIAGAIESVDSEISTKCKKLELLEGTKKALMQDLLTGKVRVNVDNYKKEERMAV